MLDAWFNVVMLTAESAEVVGLRLWKLSWGGSAAYAEACFMVTEKAVSAAETTTRLLLGASPDSVVSDYRRTVQANLRRLTT